MSRSAWLLLSRFGLTALVLASCSTGESAVPSGSGATGGHAAAGATGASAAGRAGLSGQGGFSGAAPGSGATAGSGVGGAGGHGTAGNGATSGGGRAGRAAGAGGASSSGASGLESGGAAGEGATGGEAGTNTGPGYWQPTVGLTWQWELSDTVGAILDVDVYDIDWESDQSVVAKLHAAGKKVICYVSVGSWEDFRSDADQFPAAVIGNDYAGWPGEKYLDIRADATRTRMLARFDTCQMKGFDAVEPDNMDVFELGSDSGFPLKRADGVAYAQWLAEVVHARGMGIGQKNTSSITADIESSYDWALTESCYSDGAWCGDVLAYPGHGKPVFMCEYEASTFSAACSAWQSRGYSPILKDMELGASITFCP